MNLEPFRRFIQLREEKAALNAQVKALNEQIEHLAVSLPNLLMDEGLDSINLDGHVLFCKDAAYAKAKGGDYSRLTEALMQHGYQSLCRAGSRDLNTLWNSLIKEGEEIPEWLQEVAEKETDLKLTARKQPKKK
tara:strand:- start:10228 stop:10629 length:402 start_codon:yes stop_codon:yes gene_type:complete